MSGLVLKTMRSTHFVVHPKSLSLLLSSALTVFHRCNIKVIFISLGLLIMIFTFSLPIFDVFSSPLPFASSNLSCIISIGSIFFTVLFHSLRKWSFHSATWRKRDSWEHFWYTRVASLLVNNVIVFYTKRYMCTSRVN